MRPWLLGASLASLIAVLMAVAAVLSPDHLLWNGRAVPAVDRAGIVAYSVDGVTYHQAMAAASNAPGPTPVTVYVDPSNAEAVVLDRTSARLLEGSAVAVPGVIAILLVVVGSLRQRSLARRRAQAIDEGFGGGIDADYMDRLLRKNRGGPH
jgi:hypothetical protein